MKKFKIYALTLLLFSFGACEKQVLDLESLDSSLNAFFYSNESELEMALTGVYSRLRDYGTVGANSVPIQIHLDNSATDIGVSRAFENGGASVLGTGAQSSSYYGFLNSYTFYYKAIQRANSLLKNMVKAKDGMPADRYNHIQGQALALRAYFYCFLTEYFGDVPYIDDVLESSAESLVPRTSKALIVDKLLADLDLAATLLPDKWPAASRGKISKGAALALRARIALYDKRYAEAAKSAMAVIDNEGVYGYSLHPNYQQLFQTAGQPSSEIMMICPNMDQAGFQLETPLVHGSKNFGSWVTAIPTQSMVDSYEATDGKPIDESTVYDPKRPFDNRDPRLKASIIVPGSVWAGTIYESHPDSGIYRLANGQKGGANRDSRKVIWTAPFCGYSWKKYVPEEEQVLARTWTTLNFTLLRYAEVLLIYAEAKIEAGQIDASVLNAINRIRARAYGVAVTNTAAYPAITTVNQAELRKVIRRERKVELADEGFRLFDIRRWRIAEKVMPVVIYGQILNRKMATKVPAIDDDCFVSYAGIESQYDLNTDGRFVNAQNRKFNKDRDYLSPIPLQEINTYKSMGAVLEQNAGY